ncbi:hypothetical protein H1D32_12725 [Anaerobacillus sp. CMMVII]|uniref:hypothetical protein n=1 Tax=Anaerobacillus sp. CMMVII TaxID=2755588 RepID=UPI0021B7A015|nr:hypothetical protein [Anaerobacillus sp. CMMVII]MCT8138527.1 hypothetical protein [Anaerobacillus sp. CMMVII]
MEFQPKNQKAKKNKEEQITNSKEKKTEIDSETTAQNDGFRYDYDDSKFATKLFD